VDSQVTLRWAGPADGTYDLGVTAEDRV